MLFFLFFNILIWALTYSTFHFFAIQFKRAWKKRTQYEKVVTVVAVVYESLFVVMTVIRLIENILKQSMGVDTILFGVAIIYVAIHFLVIQLIHPWKARQLYGKVVTIVAILWLSSWNLTALILSIYMPGR